MRIHSVGILGYGAFGTLVHTLVTRFAPGVEVRVYSSRRQPDSKSFFTFEEVAQSDAVVLAVPISAFKATLKKLVPLSRPETVFVDVSTVKVHTESLLKRLSGGRRWLATHPMWGPESYEKRSGDVSGFRIIMTDHTISLASYRALKTFLADIGFDIVEMRAKEHDKHLAETLFLTHFLGQVVHRAGFDRTAIDTVSFGYLMDAVESVKHDTKLFKDVFTYNPYCKKIMQRFRSAEIEVRAILENKNAGN